MNVYHERLVNKIGKYFVQFLSTRFLVCLFVFCICFFFFLFYFIRNLTRSLRSLACAADKTKLCRLSPFAKQHRNPCSGPPAVYQDLSTRHDWSVKNAIVDLPNKMTAHSVNIIAYSRTFHEVLYM